MLGVCGGIAAYKICGLVRELKKLNCEVKVVMTESAAKFVTPLTFSTLSENPVMIGLFPETSSSSTDYSVNHIQLALWADLILVAPATANTIAKIAYGFADNLLTSIILANRCPVALCPSMDVDMFENEVTQNNLKLLSGRGFNIIEPGTGFLASGLTGKGRLPDNSEILKGIEKIFLGSTKEFTGKRVVVTAGPTREFIDPVRFISNRSSGKMGYEIARAFAVRGALVTLISGPVDITPPPNVTLIKVNSSKEMFSAVKEKDADIYVMAAAVSDFTAAEPSKEKIKKEDFGMSIKLSKTDDILAWLGKNKSSSLLVGFALETNNETENALKKLETKNADIIVLNNPLIEGAGFETDTNIITILDRKGNKLSLPKMSKYDAANQIIDYTIRYSK